MITKTPPPTSLKPGVDASRPCAPRRGPRAGRPDPGARPFALARIDARRRFDGRGGAAHALPPVQQPGREAALPPPALHRPRRPGTAPTAPPPRAPPPPHTAPPP